MHMIFYGKYIPRYKTGSNQRKMHRTAVLNSHSGICRHEIHHWDIERGLGIIPWVLKTSKSWNNDPERVFQCQ